MDAEQATSSRTPKASRYHFGDKFSEYEREQKLWSWLEARAACGELEELDEFRGTLSSEARKKYTLLGRVARYHSVSCRLYLDGEPLALPNTSMKEVELSHTHPMEDAAGRLLLQSSEIDRDEHGSSRQLFLDRRAN